MSELIEEMMRIDRAQVWAIGGATVTETDMLATIYALRALRPDVAALLDGEAVAVPKEPTESMYGGARDWSIDRYGLGIGDDAARGCYLSMLAASPYAQKETPR